VIVGMPELAGDVERPRGPRNQERRRRVPPVQRAGGSPPPVPQQRRSPSPWRRGPTRFSPLNWRQLPVGRPRAGSLPDGLLL